MDNFSTHPEAYRAWSDTPYTVSHTQGNTPAARPSKLEVIPHKGIASKATNVKPNGQAWVVKSEKQQAEKPVVSAWKKKLPEVSSAEEKPLEMATKAISLNQAEKKLQTTYLNRITNVHNDDVHCLIYNCDQIISGSKDTQLKVWSSDLECQDTILNHYSRDKIDYERWVTAARPLGDGNWVAGDRKGFIRQFNNANQTTASANINVAQHVSKQRNQQRISCFGTINDNNGFAQKILVGVAKSIQIWSRDTLKMLSETTVSKNDWVYCIEHARNNRYFVVIGSDLEIWSHPTNKGHYANLKFEGCLHRELREELGTMDGKRQRPFISAIEAFDSSTLGMVDFSGRIKILDTDTCKLKSNYKGHNGRVWSIRTCTPNTFATCADDRSVKLWDVRTQAGVATFDDHPGRVSNILALQEHRIVVSSCPDDIKNCNDKASFTIWDCRR